MRTIRVSYRGKYNGWRIQVIGVDGKPSFAFNIAPERRAGGARYHAYKLARNIGVLPEHVVYQPFDWLAD